MRTFTSIAAAALLTATLAPAVFAQPAPAPAAPAPDALGTVPAKGGAKLTVTTPAFPDGGDIPFANTQYRTNTFPGLSWTAGPAGTKSYVLIMQDTDINQRGTALLHWSLYNIPGSMTKMEAGITDPPAGASYGPNYMGSAKGYTGPRTPAGPKHHYHFQIFALDTTIPADPMITYATITAAMTDQVLASGEVVGLGSIDPDAPPPPARGAGGGGRGGGGGGGGGGRGGAPATP